jgi:hypothetical protein
MATMKRTGSIREAVAIFFDSKTLQKAVDELEAAGFKPAEVGLLTGEFTVRKSLGHLYTEINASQGTPSAPPTKWVRKEAMGDTVHALLGGLAVTVGTTAAGLAVASSGIFLGALGAAAAGAAALVSAGAVFAKFISEPDAEFLQEQVEEGHLLLFVRLRDQAAEAKALTILSRYSKWEVKVYDVPRERLRQRAKQRGSGQRGIGATTTPRRNRPAGPSHKRLSPRA